MKTCLREPEHRLDSVVEILLPFRGGYEIRTREFAKSSKGRTPPPDVILALTVKARGTGTMSTSSPPLRAALASPHRRRHLVLSRKFTFTPPNASPQPQRQASSSAANICRYYQHSFASASPDYPSSPGIVSLLRPRSRSHMFSTLEHQANRHFSSSSSATNDNVDIRNDKNNMEVQINDVDDVNNNSMDAITSCPSEDGLSRTSVLMELTDRVAALHDVLRYL